MKKIFYLVTTFLFLLRCSNYININGSGNNVNKTFNLSEFNSISTSGGFELTNDVNIPISNVEITTDENLFDYLNVSVENGTLKIEPKKGYNLNPTKGIIIKASLEKVNKITSSGAINIYGFGIEKETFLIVSSGSINANLSGKLKNFSINNSGSAFLKCASLECNEVDISSSGTISAIIKVNSKIKLNISGSGSIKYYGNPSIEQNISGSVEIKKLSE